MVGYFSVSFLLLSKIYVVSSDKSATVWQILKNYGNMHHAAASVQLAPDSWPTDEPSPNVYLFIVQKYTLQRRPYPLDKKKKSKNVQ